MDIYVSEGIYLLYECAGAWKRPEKDIEFLGLGVTDDCESLNVDVLN